MRGAKARKIRQEIYGKEGFPNFSIREREYKTLKSGVIRQVARQVDLGKDANGRMIQLPIRKVYQITKRTANGG